MYSLSTSQKLLWVHFKETWHFMIMNARFYYRALVSSLLNCNCRNWRGGRKESFFFSRDKNQLTKTLLEITLDSWSVYCFRSRSLNRFWGLMVTFSSGLVCHLWPRLHSLSHEGRTAKSQSTFLSLGGAKRWGLFGRLYGATCTDGAKLRRSVCVIPVPKLRGRGLLLWGLYTLAAAFAFTESPSPAPSQTSQGGRVGVIVRLPAASTPPPTHPDPWPSPHRFGPHARRPDSIDPPLRPWRLANSSRRPGEPRISRNSLVPNLNIKDRKIRHERPQRTNRLGPGF